MAKKLDNHSSLKGKIITGAISVIGLAGSVLNSGCSGEVYFPAGKYKNLDSVLQRQIEVSKEVGPHGEGGYVGLPGFVYGF